MSDIASMLAQYTDAEGNLSGIPTAELLKVILSASSGGGAAEKKTKTRKAKDPNAPKRPKNAYMMWLEENRSRIKEELGTSKVSEVAKAAGVEWKTLEPEARKPFDERAAEAKAAYNEIKGTYVPSKTVQVQYDIGEFPEAPEGWSGPFEWKYLPSYAKGSNGKTMRFNSFQDAVEAANSLEACIGITKEYRCYTLRVGPDLVTTTNRDDEKSKGLASWLKGEPTLPEAMTTTSLTGMISGLDMQPEPTVEISDASTENASPEPTVEVSDASTEHASPEPTAEVFDSSTEHASPEPTAEVFDTSTEEDADEEVMEVTEFQYEGKDYVYDEELNVYDPEGEGDVLGKFVDGRVEFNEL